MARDYWDVRLCEYDRYVGGRCRKMTYTYTDEEGQVWMQHGRVRPERLLIEDPDATFLGGGRSPGTNVELWEAQLHEAEIAGEVVAIRRKYRPCKRHHSHSDECPKWTDEGMDAMDDELNALRLRHGIPLDGPYPRSRALLVAAPEPTP